MDNYTLDIIDKERRKKESNNFILKYEITTKNKLNNTKEKIILYLANGKKITFNYTKELEQNILDSMKKKVLDYKLFMENAQKRKIEKDALVWSFNTTSITMIASGLLISIILSNIAPLIIMLIPSALLSISGLIYKQRYTNRYKDFKKNILFIENEEKINQKALENSHIFNNVINKKTHDKMVVKPDGKKGYTINSIDKMQLKELKNMLELIKLEEQLSKKDNIKEENVLIKKLQK